MNELMGLSPEALAFLQGRKSFKSVRGGVEGHPCIVIIFSMAMRMSMSNHHLGEALKSFLGLLIHNDEIHTSEVIEWTFSQMEVV